MPISVIPLQTSPLMSETQKSLLVIAKELLRVEQKHKERSEEQVEILTDEEIRKKEKNSDLQKICEEIQKSDVSV